MILVILRLLVQLYDFDASLCPSSILEIRATMAFLMRRDLHLDDNGTPDDVWSSAFIYDPADVTGSLLPEIIQRWPGETVLQHRRRVSAAMALGERTVCRHDETFWLSLDLIDAILRFYIDLMFPTGTNKRLSPWFDPPTTQNGLLQLGPICITCIDPTIAPQVPCLTSETSPTFRANFQIVALFTGNHFITFVNRDSVNFPYIGPPHQVDPDSIRHMYRDLPLDPWENSSVEDIIQHMASRFDPPPPYSRLFMEQHFPLIFDYPLWDCDLHPFAETTHHALEAFIQQDWVLLSKYSSAFLTTHTAHDLLTPEDIFQAVSGTEFLYLAFLTPARKLCRAIYTIGTFDSACRMWRFHRAGTNHAPFPLAIWIPEETLVLALPAHALPVTTQPIFPVHAPPEILSFQQTASYRDPQPTRRQVSLERDPSPMIFNAFHGPPNWNLEIRPSNLAPRFEGLFLTPTGDARSIQASYRLFGPFILDLAPSPNESSFNLADTYLLPTREQLCFVTKTSFDQLPFHDTSTLAPLFQGSTQDTPPRFPPNCSWCTQTLSNSQILAEVHTSCDINATTELLLPLSWLGPGALSLPPASRQSVLAHSLDLLFPLTAPTLRQYLIRFAEGIPSMRFRLTQAWGTDLTLTSSSHPNPSRSRKTGSKRTRTQEQHWRRRLKHIPPHDPDRGWAVIPRLIEQIRLAPHTADPAFVARLHQIAETFGNPVDYSDSSTEIRRRLDSGALLRIPYTVLQNDEAVYLSSGLVGLYQSKLPLLRFRGLPEPQFHKWLHHRAPVHADDVYRLCHEGQITYMQPEFRPNGGVRNGKPIKNNPLYYSHRHLHEHNAASLVTQGKAVILRESVIRPEDMRLLHFHDQFSVPKSDGSLHRVVINMSSGDRHSPSYNESTIQQMLLHEYPRPTLPTLSTYCNRLHRLRQLHPNAGFLHAAVVDAKSAFQQYHLSFEKFKLVWTKLQMRLDNDWIDVIQGNLCGTFGDINGGDTWDTPAKCVLAMLRALAPDDSDALLYVDDYAILAAPVLSTFHADHRHYYNSPRPGHPPDVAEGLPPLNSESQYLIFELVTEAREILACLFGPDSTEDRKVRIFSGLMQVIGWHFDLRYTHWYVSPLPKKIDKMAHYLFTVVPPGTTATSLHNMQVITGLLCWFSVAMPIGRSFVYQLFQCKRTTANDGLVIISSAAQRDLELWRALLRLALVDPTLIGCPIDLLRTDRLPESFSVTDACTGVGGGAWTSPSPSYAPTHDLSHWLVLRWSPQELQVIQNRLLPLNTVTTDELHTLDQHLQQYLVEGASSAMFSAPRATINVLEFATVVFFVLVAAPFLKGLVVSLGADNMATLCWMVKHRSSSGAADTLLKLLSLTCTIYSIKIVVHHVKGSVNYLSDWLSRVSGIETCDHHSLLQSTDLASDATFLHVRDTHPCGSLGEPTIGSPLNSVPRPFVHHDHVH